MNIPTNQLDELLWIKNLYDFPVVANKKNAPSTSFYQPAINNLSAWANKAQEMWLAELWNQLKATANSLAWRDKYVGRIADIYAWFGNVLWQQLDNRNQAYTDQYKQLMWQYADQFNTFNSQYWPQWLMTKKLNDYYSWIANQLVNKQASDRLINAWLANKYWLSWNAVKLNQAQSDANTLSEQNKLFWDQYQQLDALNKTYNQLLDNSLKTNANLWSDYLKNVEDAKLNLSNQLSQWLIQLLLNNEQMKQNKLLAWWSSTVAKTTPPVQNTTEWLWNDEIMKSLAQWKLPQWYTKTSPGNYWIPGKQPTGSIYVYNKWKPININTYK